MVSEDTRRLFHKLRPFLLLLLKLDDFLKACISLKGMLLSYFDFELGAVLVLPERLETNLVYLLHIWE